MPPERILWESPADGSFIAAENAVETIETFGTPEGSYDISDQVRESYESPSITAVEVAPGHATVHRRCPAAGYPLLPDFAP